MKYILNSLKNKEIILTEEEHLDDEDSEIVEDEDEEVLNLENEEQNDDNQEDENNNSNNSDIDVENLTKESPWGQIYKKYKNKDVFWKLYYKIVWENNAARVENLGEAFKQELLVFGFKSQLNPMINFIEKYLIEFNLNNINYPAIHDSLVHNYINKKDITGNGILKEKNILFCKDLYNKSYQDILEYLSLQKNTLNMKNIKATDNTGKILLQMSANNAELLSNILMLDIELQNKPIKIDHTIISNSKLRDQEDILIYLQSLGFEDIKTSKSSAAATTSHFKVLVDNINDLDDAQTAMFAIANRYAVGDIGNILNHFKETSNLRLKDVIKDDGGERYQQYLNILIKAGTASEDAIQNLINSISNKQGSDGQKLLNKAGN